MSSCYEDTLHGHLAEYMIYLSTAQSFWFSLNLSYNNGWHVRDITVWHNKSAFSPWHANLADTIISGCQCTIFVGKCQHSNLQPKFSVCCAPHLSHVCKVKKIWYDSAHIWVPFYSYQPGLLHKEGLHNQAGEVENLFGGYQLRIKTKRMDINSFTSVKNLLHQHWC